MGRGWTAVVPVKGFGAAKSRLDLLAGTDPDTRSAVARAMVLDTVAAVLGADSVSRVVVVTDDAEVSAAFAGLDVEVVADAGAGLNAAIETGAHGSADVVAVLGDLPALTPAALDDAIAQVVPGERAHVVDSAGTGTTLLIAHGPALAPAFGPGSAAAHSASGSRALQEVHPGARIDVDTRDDLVAAARTGVGANTRRWLAVALAGATRPEPAAPQATVRTWGEDGGSAFLDDGTVVALVADARNWHPGQRVRIDAVATGGWRALLPEPGPEMPIGPNP